MLWQTIHKTSRLRLGWSLLAALTLCSFATAQPWNTAENLCFPQAVGVPGNPGPPDWWSAPGADRDAPRWRGAARRTWGAGVAPEAFMRGLRGVDGGVTYLYLSFDVPFDPSLDVGQDVLVVTLASLAMEYRAIVFPIADQSAKVAQPAASLEFASRASGATPWDNLPIPAWLSGQTRVWVETDGMGDNGWTVQMRIPVGGAGSFNLPTQFGYFSALLVQTAGGVLQHRWPRSSSPISESFAVPDFHNGLPPVSQWGEGSTDDSCTSGVTLAWNQIGTTNPDPHTINLTSPNTFFASPFNGTSTLIGIGEISARFRLANWGAMPPGGVQWREIASASSTASISPMSNTPAGALQAGWTVPPAEHAFYTANNHQCILVQLNASINLDFSNDSVVRNMDFVEASTFERTSQVSSDGLGDPPSGQTEHTVWLFLEKENLPQATFASWLSESFSELVGFFQSGDDQGQDVPTTGLQRGQSGRQVGWRRGGQGSGDPEALSKRDNWPVYRLHAYSETGEFVTLGGQRSPVLRILGSYGYYVRHEGSLAGWNTVLSGAEQVAPNVYRLGLGRDQAVQLQDRIEAKEGNPWLILLLILLLLVLLWLLFKWLRRRGAAAS